MGMSKEFEAIRTFLHTIWWRRVDLNSSSFGLIMTSPFDYSNATMTIKRIKYASFVVYICVPNVNWA